ncbi:hypothetical protein COOONC_04205 [Cooperia oncophora]
MIQIYDIAIHQPIYRSSAKSEIVFLKYSRDVSGVVDNLRLVLERADNRLALHLFSMNAIYTVCALMLQYPELNVLGRSDGIVFDSCPVIFDESSPRSFTNLADAFAKSTLKNATLTARIQFLLWRTYFILAVRMFIAEQFARSLMGVSLTNFTPYHFIRDHPSMPRNLSFVYSDKDTICPPKYVSFRCWLLKKGNYAHYLVFRMEYILPFVHTRVHRFSIAEGQSANSITIWPSQGGM